MKDLCYSVRVESMIRCRNAYKVRSFDGREDFIPVQFVYERDWEVEKVEAYWISAWILKKKNLQYSERKSRWIEQQTGQKIKTRVVERHRAKRVKPVESNKIEELTR